MLLMLSVVLGGKLAEGFRGVPYGTPIAEVEKPSPDCIDSPDDGVKWSCPSTIGEVSVRISWMEGEGLFLGPYISAEGFSQCEALHNSLVAGWGPGKQENDYDNSALPAWNWNDGNAIASFEYNRYSQVCFALAFDMKIYGEVEAKKKEKAAKAVDDL